MVSAKLRELARWRRPLRRLRSGRLWKLYDQAYDPLVGHAEIHEHWLAAKLSPAPRSIFSIGPGRGELELSLCRQFNCEFGYAESYARYSRTVETGFRKAGLAGCIVERHRASYKTFTPAREYDLVLSIHSWYAFGYDVDLLRGTLDMLTPGGSLILTVAAKDDFFYRSGLIGQHFSAQELSAWARGAGFENTLHLIPKPVADAALLRDGELTEAARGIVSFLTGRLWGEIPEAERTVIQRKFIEGAEQGGVRRDYGLLHFRR